MNLVRLLSVSATTILLLTIASCSSKRIQEGTVRMSSLVDFIELVSRSDKNSVREMEQYLSDPNQYIRQNQEDLWDEDFLPEDELIPTLVVESILLKSGYILYRDSSYESELFLVDINKLSGGILSNLECFNSLMSEYQEQKYGIANYLTPNKLGSTPYKCINSAGLALLAINDGSDSLPFFLVELAKLTEVVQLANKSGLRLYFADQNA